MVAMEVVPFGCRVHGGGGRFGDLGEGVLILKEIEFFIFVTGGEGVPGRQL
jgi:hypothetical protein